MRRAIPTLLASALAVSLPAAAPQSTLDLEEVVVEGKRPPIEAYVAFPRYDSVVISPDGTRLAMTQTERPERQLTVVDFPSAKVRDTHFFPSHVGIEDVRWFDSGRLLVQPDVANTGFRLTKDLPGQLMMRSIESRGLVGLLEDVSASGKDSEGTELIVSELIDRTDKGRNQTAKGPVRLIAARAGEPRQILFQTHRSNDDGNTDGFGAFLMDPASRAQRRVAISPLPGGQFITGPEQRIALITGTNAAGGRATYYLPPEARAGGRDWQPRAGDRTGDDSLVPVAWTGRGEEYYALEAHGAPTRGVVAWDAEQDTRRLLYRNADADMVAASLDATGRAWMFSGESHFPVYWYPDPAHPLARLHRTLVQQLPRERVEVMNATDDYSIAVVRVGSAKRPPLYLVIDAKAVRTLDVLSTFPQLRGTRLSPVDAVEFRARDGVMIRGYLTTPVDVNGKLRRDVPLVVIAHDEPADGRAADYGYEFERQLFASRGYAVLQVNHRGTGGRGREFLRAGDGKWGREVQDDFADAVKWAVKDGVASPDRICFYGSGYGAYSAMMTAAREPGLFTCLIGLTGVYDLPRLFDKDSDNIPRNLRQVLGSDLKELQARSPVSNAGTIKAKVMLFHEPNERIPLSQGTAMRDALKRAGNTAQYEVIGREYSGHYYPASRAEVYTKIFGFLDKYFQR